MKLYIKQQLFSFKDRFEVFNENGEAVYYVEGKLFTFAKKLTIYDMSGNVIIRIEQKLAHWMPHYTIIANDGSELTVKKKMAFRPSYVILGTDWRLQGDYWGHDYEVVSGNELIMQVRKKWFAWADTYELAIGDDRSAALCLAIVIIIDACISAERAAA